MYRLHMHSGRIGDMSFHHSREEAKEYVKFYERLFGAVAGYAIEPLVWHPYAQLKQNNTGKD